MPLSSYQLTQLKAAIFAKHVLSGSSAGKAYVQLNEELGLKRPTPASASTLGAKMMKRPDVLACINKAREEVEKQSVMTLLERRLILAQIARFDSEKFDPAQHGHLVGKKVKKIVTNASAKDGDEVQASELAWEVEYITPDHKDRMRAIELDSKLAGELQGDSLAIDKPAENPHSDLNGRLIELLEDMLSVTVRPTILDGEKVEEEQTAQNNDGPSDLERAAMEITDLAMFGEELRVKGS